MINTIAQKASIPIFNTSLFTTYNICEFATHTQKFKKLSSTLKLVLKFSDLQKYIRLIFSLANSIDQHLGLKITPQTTHIFNLKQVLIGIIKLNICLRYTIKQCN